MPPLFGHYPVGTTASHTCDYGYQISGTSSRTCQSSATWNQQAPTCNQSDGIFILILFSIRNLIKFNFFRITYGYCSAIESFDINMNI